VGQPEKIQLTFSPAAERYVRRDAPVEVRRMAARGALPLPPSELAAVLFALAHDTDDEVKDRARASLENLPDAIMGAVLEGDTQAPVLSYLAHVLQDHAEHVERIALNACSNDATIAFLASLHHKRVVDIIANNQKRMLRCPDIVEALGANPLTGRAVIDRILSFLGLSRPDAEVPEDPGGDAVTLSVEALSDSDAEAALRAILHDDASTFVTELVDDDADVDEAKQKTLYTMLQEMSIFQKIKLARMGNKEARALLVRDRNKIVASAAVRSPKISENEVVTFAKARNICEEVLRIIGANREWTRNYQVKRALAMNPKCPRPMAVKFLNYLQERDLRGIMRSKEVPTAVSTHARRILTKKGKL
jgi:hypothetical protein